MTELQKLALLVALYGGPNLLALFILLIGRLASPGRLAVVAIASLCSVLIGVNALVLYFLMDMGSGWAGGDSSDFWLIQVSVGLTLFSIAMTAWFLSTQPVIKSPKPR